MSLIRPCILTLRPGILLDQVFNLLFILSDSAPFRETGTVLELKLLVVAYGLEDPDTKELQSNSEI